MTDPYKKRAKAGWNVGKGCKSESNRAERQYDDEEIEDQLAETSNSGKKSNTKKTQKHKDIIDILRTVRTAVKFGDGSLKNLKDNKYNLMSYRFDYYNKSIQIIPKLRVLLSDSEVPSKIKRQIKEVLDLVGSDL